ncbi:MAG: hypothetical protein IKJ05_00140 [Oscillospiraceae bacterium]|nr:hypothetical protein [Oscillospiraceae bacterium]
MLGNVKPFLPALSEENRTRYSAVYCGLCDTLGRDYGVISRFLLNYDMAFVALIYDDLHHSPFETRHRGCIANPLKKKDIMKATAGTEYAADVLILLAYYKLLDNIYDEKFFKKAGCMAVYPYFLVKVQKAQKRHPQLAQVLKQQSENQQQAEKNAVSIDSVAMPTARMTQAILAECSNDEKDSFAVKQCGFFLGRVIYLLDALTDRDTDAKENKFNIFNILKLTEEQAKAECFMALGEMAHWYRQIDFKDNKDIIENIIYMSMARKIKFAGEEKEQ